MPSLYVQDTWTIGNRLTLNLGVRTENETIPSFRTDIKDTAFEFGYGKKIAPRLGATYDVLGDGRMKAFGSWGRYYDWVKYELARGSFGGDTWLVNYRSLDTLDVNSLSLANMPGTGPLGRRCAIGACRTSTPSIRTSSRCSRTATNLGLEYQLTPTTALRRQLRPQQAHARDRRRRLARCNRQRGLLRRQPGRRRRDDDVRDRPDGAVQHAEAAAAVRRARAVDQPPLLEQLVRQREPHHQPAVWQLRRAGELGRDLHADDRASSATAQQQAGSIARPGTAAGRAWDLDELEWDSHGNLDVRGRLATDRPVVAKFYGVLPRCRSARRLAGSSTPAAARR